MLRFLATSALLIGAAACSPATPRPSAPSPTGPAWQLRLAVNQRSSYTGTVAVSGSATALVADVRLTSPLPISAQLTGTMVGDSVSVRGPYSAANGCTGTMTLAIRPDSAGWAGSSVIEDRCAGTLRAAAQLRR